MKFNGFDLKYVDSLLIVDKHYNMLHTIRFNPRFDDSIAQNVYSEYQNRNYFEIFPELKETESTVVECIKHGKTVVRKNQVNIDMNGNVFKTNNVTIPIIKRGEVVGAVELSQDITSIENAGISKVSGESDMKQSNLNTDDDITFNDIITVNSSMKESIRKAKIFSEYDNPVLIYGETGTGKELFVRAMVSNSLKDRSKFIAQNCAAIPETLFESILFGTRKGAYTGAKDAKGLFQLADGGFSSSMR